LEGAPERKEQQCFSQHGRKAGFCHEVPLLAVYLIGGTKNGPPEGGP